MKLVKEGKSTCERLAAYVRRASWDDISPESKGKVKQHVLDTLGCAAGAIPSEVIAAIRNEQDQWTTTGPCSYIGGSMTTPERAAFYNGALVRYLDYMDTFLAPGEACHPSDNLAGILAAAEMGGASGREFLVAIAIAYHVQCRLTASGVPIMRKGFDHTIQLAISLACGMSRVLDLTETQTAHAIALCATSGLALAASRSGEHVPQWKGLASAGAAFQAIHNVRLAQSGITGSLHVFEGPLGLEEVLGKPFGINWDAEAYDGILACSIKRYNAEFHAQSAIEAALRLRSEYGIAADDVQGIQVDIFKAAYDMIGGGKYLNPKTVSTKEDADHSLPYLMAVAMLDGAVGPEQFESERIRREDVQKLLQHVVVWLSLAYTRDYPNSLPCKVRVGLRDGRIFEAEEDGYPGFFRRPVSVESLMEKFKSLASVVGSERAVQGILEAVAHLENGPISDLTAALRELRPERAPELAMAGSAGV